MNIKSSSCETVRTDQESSTATDVNYQNEIDTVSFKRRLRRWFYRRLIRLLMLFHIIALMVAGWIGRRSRRPAPGEGNEIMVTGRFDSDNWILAHLGPLSASRECSRLWMVSTNPIPSMPKVEGIYPPRWLMRVAGPTLARLLVFTLAAIRKRPHIVGGFHLLLNGMGAAIVGRLVGARSVYFCVGGPAEISGGGVWGEDSNAFAKMETPDPIVEKRLIKIVSACDMIITMGTRAVTFFRDKGVDTDCHVVSGGINSKRFRPTGEPPAYDLIFTGRLATIKRVDIFLQAVKYVAEVFPDIKVAIVGDGRLREELRQIACNLGITGCVTFTGHQACVEDWLRDSRIFVLTSDSEGLSLSMIEAMMCGLPAVVSDVGDLADLVEDGTNGFLVPRRSPREFANRISELLNDNSILTAFSKAAHSSARRYEVENTIQQWDTILASGETCERADCSSMCG